MCLYVHCYTSMMLISKGRLIHKNKLDCSTKINKFGPQKLIRLIPKINKIDPQKLIRLIHDN